MTAIQSHRATYKHNALVRNILENSDITTDSNNILHITSSLTNTDLYNTFTHTDDTDKYYDSFTDSDILPNIFTIHTDTKLPLHIPTDTGPNSCDYIDSNVNHTCSIVPDSDSICQCTIITAFNLIFECSIGVTSYSNNSELANSNNIGITSHSI